jgi:hypothetical protein
MTWRTTVAGLRRAMVGKGTKGWRALALTGSARALTMSATNARVEGSTHEVEGSEGVKAKDGIGMQPGRRIRRSAQR